MIWSQKTGAAFAAPVNCYVLMATVAAAAMTAAVVAFIMMMLSVMVALNIGIIQQIAGNQGSHSCISAAGNTAVQLNACCCQSHLSTAADTAADENICVESSQHTGQGTVTAAVGIHNLRGYYLTVLDIIDFKFLGMAEMLENHTIFISDCNSHCGISFRFFILFMIMLLITEGLPAVLGSVTKPEISSGNLKGFAFDQHLCQFFPGGCVNHLNRGTRNTHPLSAGFLG